MRTPMLRAAVLIGLGVVLGGCAETGLVVHAAKQVPAERGRYKVGTPYQINGVWYYPAEDFDYDETGIASWYGPQFHNRETANGETFDMNAVSAAHRTLPMPSFVRVTNLENGRSIVVRVNDRGPYAHGRILDLSRRSAQLLGFEQQGTAKVRVQIMPDESRAIALRLQNKLPEDDGRPAPDAAPRVAVAAETLPPPGSKERPKPVLAAAKVERGPLGQLGEPDVDRQPIVQQPVNKTNVYIQAGAFQRYDNANQVSARLSSLGKTQIQPAKVASGEVFRVRMGPLASVDEADKILDMVIRSGYPDARVVVD
jgi:rare lipoprotein A